MSELFLLTWPLLLLLALSAFFSASETALFSLTREQRARAAPRVERLLERPRDLLVTVLLCNLLVNVFFFSLAAKIDVGEEPHARVAAAFGALVALLVFGEILPKTLALRLAEGISRSSSLVLPPLVQLFHPATLLASKALELFTRALGESGGEEHAITSEQLAQVLTKSAETGVLENNEADMLADIVELGGVRVREIMTPRVDALMLDLDDEPDEIAQEALRRHLTWLPVIEDDDPDKVLGIVRVRDLLLREGRRLRQLVMPVKFVPEVARVLSLLHEFREARTAEAVVVDEWGGTAGIVTIEEVFEEIVGELRVEGEERERPVVPLGEGRFRVTGALSIRDWNDEFGFQVVPTEFETVGASSPRCIGRIPKAGDEAHAGNLFFEVHDVRGRRIVSVDMYVRAEEVPA
ncbi:MAG: HlyC/CorC family transporter [Planctomycetes bacterium]|nr:HlyC/CorC family transporter [Planctomycetota bacterium]